ncbi:uncharacterized protein LOC107042291 [Diachasma alloeum]|uniref:uncharacterized protein LOC107042291 n=1 Tax=Diachasma alloeum TaxID=454923 RepID=UPI000738306A|nr:uncharacterized protein LOC107042291 [Diachasma alloeum]
MALSMEEKTRINYLQQRIRFFSNQVLKVKQYLESTTVDSINAKLRFTNLATIYETSQKHNDELLCIQPDDPQINVFLEAESQYYEVGSAVTKLQQVEPLMNSTMNPNNITITERQDLPKLPEIKLPTFEGKRENWSIYKNKFISLVHSRTDISDTVKCSHLFNSLTDQAAAKISQYETSGKDYAKAWKDLLDFYDHKRIVAVEHLNAILDLPKLNKASVDELSGLLDTALQHLHILEGLGAKSGEDFVVRIIERCLPPSVRNKWQDKLEMDELPKLDNLIKFIRLAIFKQQAQDTVTPNTNPNLKKKRGESPSHAANKKFKVTSTTFATTTTPDSSRSWATPVGCPKCKETHRLFKCPNFNQLGIQERWNFIKSIKACKNCLWVHKFPCMSEQRCKKCNLNHHTLLHNEKGSQVKAVDNAPSKSINPPL